MIEADDAKMKGSCQLFVVVHGGLVERRLLKSSVVEPLTYVNSVLIEGNRFALRSAFDFDARTQRLTMFALRSFKSAEASRPPVTDSRSSGTDTNVADLPLSESLRRWCPTRKICTYRKPDLSRGHLRFCTSWAEPSPSDAGHLTQPMGLHPCITTQTYPPPKATWQCRNRSPTRAVWDRIWPDHV